MKSIFIILVLFSVLFLNYCDISDYVITHEVDCNISGDIYCESDVKYYCSMNHEKIKVCDIVADCNSECLNELINIMQDDIQGNL